jgi:S1-C subfamily serine protease
MASLIEWKVPQASQPRAEDYPYDLERALSSVVGLHSIVPSDAFTADTLGVERAGNGVLIDDGVVLTIGYLITEAETVWLHLSDGRVVQGHPLGFDQETGFGLVQALGKIDFPSLEVGSSKAVEVGERVVVGGAGGRTRSLGTALISSAGKLIGIGSLQLERAREGKNEYLNMIVPIDLLSPVLEDIRKFGRVNRPVRPWLGLYSTEIEDKIVVVGIAPKGPAARAEIKTGDVVVAVKGDRVSTLASFYRKVWALGNAGAEVPLTLYREGVTFDVRVNSSDRTKFLKGPRLH